MKKLLFIFCILFSLVVFGSTQKNYYILPKQQINTNQAPLPIGVYSQAIQVGNTVYLSGQIPLDPSTNKLATGIEQQVDQAFKNLIALANAAGGDSTQIVKLNIFLTDLNNISIVNATMAKYFSKPYPARSTVAVVALAKGAAIEVEGTMVLNCTNNRPKPD